MQRGGGFIPYFWTSTKRGGAPDSTNMNKGREGVKSPENFADILYGWPLTTYAFGLTPVRADADVLNGRPLIIL